jgi:YfiH family protein
MGFSKPPYESFNIGLSNISKDDPQTVIANRSKLKQDLSLPGDPVWLIQTHSTNVICLDNIGNIEKTKFEADASFTTKPNIVCAVLTADCLPLRICSKNSSVVAAIHAGWQGLAAGIIESTLDKLKSVIKMNELLVWLGPAIGPNAFIVKEDVLQKFIDYDLKAKLAFRQFDSKSVDCKKLNDFKFEKDQKFWHCNIYTIARQRLNNYGIRNIYGGEFCTYTEKDLFFSYRRDNKVTGRMASIIYREYP